MYFNEKILNPDFIKALEEANDNKFDFTKLVKVEGKRRYAFTCPDHGPVSQSTDYMDRVPACPGCFYLKQKADPNVNTPVRVPACLKLKDPKYYQVHEDSIQDFIENHTEEVSGDKRVLMPYKWNVGVEHA